MRTILLAAILAVQGIEANRIQAITELMEAGKTKTVLQLLDNEGARAAFAADPKALATICSEAGDNAAILGSSKDDARALAALLEGMAEAAVGAAPEKADAHWAVAESRVAAGRLLLRSGEKDLPPDRWIAAADALEKAYEAEPRNGAALSTAAEALVEALVRTGADVPALQSRATALMGKALEKHPDSVAVLKSATLLDVERTRRLLEAKDKAGADTLLAAALLRLAPHLKGPSTDIDVATAHNEAISFARAHSKDLKKPKGEFLTAPARLGGVLDAMVPMGRLWSKSGEGDAVFQFTPEFKALRSFGVDTYAWDTEWQLGDGTKVGGDNLSGLAGNEYAISVRKLKKVQSKRPPTKARLNKWVDDGYYYEVAGVDADGDWTFARTWFFKCKGGQMTSVRFTMYDFIEGRGMDAAAQLVLDSVKEAPKK